MLWHALSCLREEGGRKGGRTEGGKGGRTDGRTEGKPEGKPEGRTGSRKGGRLEIIVFTMANSKDTQTAAETRRYHGTVDLPKRK